MNNDQTKQKKVDAVQDPVSIEEQKVSNVSNAQLTPTTPTANATKKTVVEGDIINTTQHQQPPIGPTKSNKKQDSEDLETTQKSGEKDTQEAEPGYTPPPQYERGKSWLDIALHGMEYLVGLLLPRADETDAWNHYAKIKGFKNANDPNFKSEFFDLVKNDTKAMLQTLKPNELAGFHTKDKAAYKEVVPLAEAAKKSMKELREESKNFEKIGATMKNLRDDTKKHQKNIKKWQAEEGVNNKEKIAKAEAAVESNNKNLLALQPKLKESDDKLKEHATKFNEDYAKYIESAAKHDRKHFIQNFATNLTSTAARMGDSLSIEQVGSVKSIKKSYDEFQNNGVDADKPAVQFEGLEAVRKIAETSYKEDANKKLKEADDKRVAEAKQRAENKKTDPESTKQSSASPKPN